MTCGSCGGQLVQRLEEEGSKHYARMECEDCRRWHSFVKKPENEGKRRDKNKKWRKMWQEIGFVCVICGATTEEYKHSSQWEIDHKVPLGEEGEDVFENTMVLCTFCHSIKNTERKRLKALRRTMKGVLS